MMPGLGVVRVGIDPSSGHDGFNPRPAVVGSLTTFCEGLPVVRVGDEWALHTDILTVHDGRGIAGSPTVFVEGLPLMRVSDPISCGSVALSGSLTVFSG